ncbi:MAG: hypothetical protein Q8P41_29915 [Pseudomonadota bacterium]|nr:hypothetical protein [Pseudomonadota bacterium]
MTCPCSQPMPAPGNYKAARRLTIDRAALRHELGDVLEIREAMIAKGAGRPSANVNVLWQLLTKSVYRSGDLPWLATRESLQNGWDAIRAAIRARQIKADDARFAVGWDGATRTLVFDDNGIGMNLETILGKFLAIGESGKRDAADSGEAAGGFGVAKAVILGSSRSFRWEMHTRDNLAVANGMTEEVQVYEAPARQGTKLAVHDVDPDLVRYWDRARGTYVGIEDRIRELLAGNDLPGLTLVFNDVEVEPMFSRRGGSKVSVEGSWGEGTTAAVKAYRRAPGDRGGAYYLRLNGLLQLSLPAQRGALKADVVIDLATSVRPGQRGYPFNAARDALQDQAAWTFADLVEEVERENESVGANAEDEFLDPEGDDAGGDDIADQMAEAFGDADVQRAIAEAAGGIRDFYGEQAKYGAVEEAIASRAPRGTKAVADGDAPERGWVLPAGMTVAAGESTEPDIAAPSDVQAARVLRTMLTDADDQGKAAGGIRVVIVTEQVDQALRRAEAGEQLDGWQTQAVEAAIDRAAEAALAPGGGGLIQAVAVSRATSALDAITPAWAKSMDKAEGRRVRNPFGKFAGMRISKKTYDRDRARRFRKNYAKWVPFLLAWDGTLRMVATEARIRRTFRPGFVLDDNVVGEAVERPGGRRFVFIHPDRFAQVAKAHRERPLALAAFLHGVACHELTHIDGKMGDGHDEEFISRREDLGAATAHLLPAIAVLVSKLLRLPERESEELKRAARLERQVAELREGAREAKRSLAALTRERDRLAGNLATTRAADTGGSRAERMLEAAVVALRERPPAGIEASYVEKFVGRHREGLLEIVRASFPN